MFFGIDLTYIYLVLPAVLFALWAQFNVQSTFSKYSKVQSRSGMTGYDSARRILDANGLHNVGIARVSGNLTDHYNPKDNTIYLSDSVYGETTAAAIGVAAHEAGHAVQHAVGYTPMKVRSAIIPVTQIGSNLAMPLFLLGIILSYPTARAMDALRGYNLDSDDLASARKVLTAAALTYVAALAVSLANLLRLFLIASRMRGRRD